MTKGPSVPPKILNRKVRYDFELLETVEAGIALTGSEVKSLRDGRASLEESYAYMDKGELFLLDCNISPYPNATCAQHKPTRPRKLLLHRRQIKRWADKVTQRGLTIVPTSIHFNERGIAKVDLALARGKTHGDKRDSIKRRDQQRDIDQALKRRR
jgi:SsrA-binding protein